MNSRFSLLSANQLNREHQLGCDDEVCDEEKKMIMVRMNLMKGLNEMNFEEEIITA